jgi:uncharacterized protein (DUF697 family)/GTP-binding protein EngB required for normal cell division
MSDSENRKHLERAVEASRDRVERTAEDIADRFGRAWQAVRGRVRAGEPTSETPTGEQPLDETQLSTDELFSRERRREIERLGHANILVIGQTGVGKSTLINAVFRKELARAETGRPVTKVIQRFDDPAVPVTLYDSKGVELGDSRKQVIRDFKRTIAKSRKAAIEEHIHLLWYCMDAGQTRVQDYDVDIIRELAEEVPVILVFTQTIDDHRADELEATIREIGLPIASGHAVRTLAAQRRIGGQVLEPRGLEELARLTNDLLPEAVRRAFANAQGVVIGLKVDQSRALVVGASATAAAAAAAPVPGSDAMMLKPIQVGMLAGITAIFGIELTNAQIMSLLTGVIGKGAMEKAGKRLVREVAKHVPGGNVVNATVAAALTGALGEAYIRACTELLRRKAAGKPLPEPEMLQLFVEAYESILRKPRAEAVES